MCCDGRRVCDLLAVVVVTSSHRVAEQHEALAKVGVYGRMWLPGATW